MKKLILFFVSVLLVVSFMLPTMASAETGADKTDQEESENMFAEINSINDIKNSIDNDQILSFFDGQEVELDFNYVLPVFMPSNSNTASKYRDALEFSKSYVVPVSTAGGKSLGMVKLQKYDASWVVGVFYENYDLQGLINKINIPADTKTVFVENIFENEFAVLACREGEELYYSLDYESRRELNGDQLIRELALSKQGYKEDAEGAGVPINGDVSYKWVFYAVPVALLILLCGLIVFSKTRRKA